MAEVDYSMLEIDEYKAALLTRVMNVYEMIMKEFTGKIDLKYFQKTLRQKKIPKSLAKALIEIAGVPLNKWVPAGECSVPRLSDPVKHDSFASILCFNTDDRAPHPTRLTRSLLGVVRSMHLYWLVP